MGSQNLQVNPGSSSGVQKGHRQQAVILAHSRPSSALLNCTFDLTTFIISKQQVLGQSGNVCNLLVPARPQHPTDTLQIPLLPGIPHPLLIWHFPCCFWDLSEYILNVHLLHLSSCSTASAFWLKAAILEVLNSSTKSILNSWGLLEVMRDICLHAEAPKILLQSGPCLGQRLLCSFSCLLAVQRQVSNQILQQQTAWWQQLTVFFFTG